MTNSGFTSVTLMTMALQTTNDPILSDVKSLMHYIFFFEPGPYMI